MKKYLTIGLLVAILIMGLGTAHGVMAQSAVGSTIAPPTVGGFFSCVTNLPSCMVYYVSSFLDTVFHLLIDLGADLIGWTLALNQNVFQSPMIQTGFSASLILANLGFVLGIIIIALATILRRETYGIKKTLWKVIVMAIFVNFGLVVTAPIVGFADNLSNFFVQKAGGTSDHFIVAFTSRFAPQALFQPPKTSNDASDNEKECQQEEADAIKDSGGAEDGGVAAGQIAYETCVNQHKDLAKTNANANATDSATQGLLTLVIAGIFEAIVAFTFLTIGLMLFMRYLWLGFLLVILPLAWLMWIFPQLSGNFKKWWSNFIRWTFFPVVALFFIYLAMSMATLDSSGNLQTGVNAPGANASNSATIGLEAATGQQEGFLQTGFDELLLVGLCLGGLIAADKMSITGADIALKGARSAGNAMKGYVGRKGKKAVAKLVPEGAKNKLQEGRAGIFPRRVQSWMGRGLGNVQKAGTSAMVERHSAWAKEKMKDPEEAKRLLVGSLNKDQRLALLKEMDKQDKISGDMKVDGKTLKEVLNSGNEEFFKSAGQGGLFKDLNKRIGSTPISRKAEEAIEEASKTEESNVTTDKEGFLGTPGAIMPMLSYNREMLDAMRNNEKEAEMAAKISPTATIVDRFGLIGKRGAEVNAQAYLDHQDRQQMLRQKEYEIKATEDKINNTPVEDVNGTLGTKGAMVSANELAQKEVEKMVEDLSKEDARKIAGRVLYGEGARLGFDEKTADKIASRLARAIMRSDSGQHQNAFIPKLKSKELRKFRRIYGEELDKYENDATSDEKSKVKKLRKLFNRSIDENISHLNGSHEEHEEKGGEKSGGGKGGHGGGGNGGGEHH